MTLTASTPRTVFTVEPHRTNGPGYCIKISGERPCWSPTGFFGKWPDKAEAQRVANAFNLTVRECSK